MVFGLSLGGDSSFSEHLADDSESGGVSSRVTVDEEISLLLKFEWMILSWTWRRLGSRSVLLFRSGAEVTTVGGGSEDDCDEDDDDDIVAATFPFFIITFETVLDAAAVGGLARVKMAGSSTRHGGRSAPWVMI